MNYTNRRVALAALAVAGLAIAGPLALAFGDASNKQPGFLADSNSAAGLGIDGLLSVGNTSAGSHTEKDKDATASSSANSLSVLGTQVVPSSSCSATGGDGGAVRDKDSNAVLEPDLGVVSARVLASSCDAKAVKSNNAQGSADASVLEVSAADTNVAVLSSSSDAKTTSGNSHSKSEFSVVSVGGTSLLGCTSESRSSNGNTSTSSSATVLAPVTAVNVCPLASSDASYSRS